MAINSFAFSQSAAVVVKKEIDANFSLFPSFNIMILQKYS